MTKEDYEAQLDFELTVLRGKLGEIGDVQNQIGLILSKKSGLTRSLNNAFECLNDVEQTIGDMRNG